MKHTYWKGFRLVALLLVLSAIFAVCACNTEADPQDTVVTAEATEVVTEVATEQEDITEAETTVEESTLTHSQDTAEAEAATQGEVPADTAAETRVETQSETEAATEVATEAATEAETQALIIPSDAPKSNDLITFCDFSANTELFTGKYSTSEIVKDEKGESVLKLATQGSKLRNSYFRLDYARYMEILELDAIAWGDCAFAVLTLKVENVTGSGIEIVAKGKQWDTNFQVQGSGTYRKDADGWQTVVIPLPVTNKKSATLEDIRINFAKDATVEGETVYIKSIGLTSDREKMISMIADDLVKPMETTLKIPGLKNDYTFLHITDLHVSAYSDADTAGMTSDRKNLLAVRRNAFKADGIFAEERMPYMFAYADKINADLTLLTGDILDFPSGKNVSLLQDTIQATKTPDLFILGNHDWCYGDDDYFSANAIQNQIPLFNQMSAGEPANDPNFHYVEYEDLLVVAVDNSQDMVTKTTVDKFMALYEKNKPIILILHVPMYVETLTADSVKVWKKDLGMGGKGVNAWHPENDVERFYNAVCLDENTPVVAVVAGHVHFNHEDVFPNGVPQYITTTAYTGDCRVIRVTGV